MKSFVEIRAPAIFSKKYTQRDLSKKDLIQNLKPTKLLMVLLFSRSLSFVLIQAQLRLQTDSAFAPNAERVMVLVNFFLNIS